MNHPKALAPTPIIKPAKALKAAKPVKSAKMPAAAAEQKMLAKLMNPNVASSAPAVPGFKRGGLVKGKY